jgi:signal transduction histidine kinase
MHALSRPLFGRRPRSSPSSDTQGARGARRHSASNAPARRLVIAFVVVAAVFVGSTIYTHRVIDRLQEQVVSMRTNALPSLVYIDQTRRGLRSLQLYSERLIPPVEEDRVTLVEKLSSAREDLERQVIAYTATPNYPGEEQKIGDVHAQLVEVDSVIRDIQSLPPNASSGQIEALRARLFERIEATENSLFELFMLNAAGGAQVVSRIEDVRTHARRADIILDIAALFVALAAARSVLRSFRNHNRVLEERADELEAFSSRVAHDILSPLSTTLLAIGVAERECGSTPARNALERGKNALGRVSNIVEALLAFARSSSTPAERGHSNVVTVARSVLEESRYEGEHSAHVEVNADEKSSEVVCSAGTLTSIVSNLLSNAVKYGAHTIELDARPKGKVVCTEVRDDGPGVPPDVEPLLFLPHALPSGVGVHGLGLGLATVRRLVEAHGGSIGYSRRRGGGSIFWFELPRYASTDAPHTR